MNNGQSFKTILEKYSGVGPGFDILRLGLSVIILAAHCSGLVGNSNFASTLVHNLMQYFGHLSPAIPVSSLAPDNVVTPDGVKVVSGFARPFSLSHVPMFFALSGFLVAGSAYRSKRVAPFLALRFFRIFPALVVEVSLSAIVLGAIFTHLPLSEYYRSTDFITYFGNIIGFAQLEIASVDFPYSHNDFHTLNGNLWTLPAELHSYAAMAVLIASGLLFNRRAMTGLVLIYTVAMIIANGFFGFETTPGRLPAELNIYYFIAGVLCYIWRDKIIYDWRLFILAGLGAWVLMYSNRTLYISPFLLVYVTIFIGLTPFPQSKILKSGDYSYGMYLYGYPITQALLTVIPILRGNLFLLLPTTLAVSGLFSFLSWHLIEKRFLRLRKLFSPESAKIAASLHPDALKTSE